MIKLFKLVLIILFLSIISGDINAQHSMQMTDNQQTGIIEITSFKLAPGVEEQEFIQTAQAMQTNFLDHQKGFIKRTLVKGNSGWTDVVYWENKGSLEQAMQKAESAKEAAPFMQMIDFTSVSMNVAEVKFNSN